MSYWENLLLFLRALGDDCAYFIPFLALLALLNREVLCRRPANLFFFTAVFWFLGWRLVYALSMRGGSRYYQLPVILLTAIAPAAFPVVFRYLGRCRFRGLIVAGLFLFCVGLGIGKALNPPAYKKYIVEMAGRLAEERQPGILLDASGNSKRFKLLLPEWEITPAGKDGLAATSPFWCDFFDFIRRRQGEGKPLYLLLRDLREERPGERFAEACRREWGMFPFRLLHRMSDAKYGYALFVYTFPDGLFGLPGVTPVQTNPYGLRLPLELKIRRGKPYVLPFSAILSGRVLQQWGGVEVDVRYGEVDDAGWYITPDENMPEEFPLAVTLYLANGWPAGYAECTVRVTDSEADLLPELPSEEYGVDFARVPERWRNCLPVPSRIFVSNDRIKLLTKQLANVPGVRCALPEETALCEVKVQDLTQPVFWIGSRNGGSPFVTDWLKKRHPELKLFRLEEHPYLSYSGDPRYAFSSLTTPRKPLNPLLNSDGEIDWPGYLAEWQLPEFRCVVLALGFEEVMYQGRRTAFHIDSAMASLRNFLTALRKVSPECRVLIILPLLPSDRAEFYRKFSSSPYIYGFRWSKRHNYRRLAEGVEEVAKEFPDVTVLPTCLWVPAGESERSPAYLEAIDCYLQYLEQMRN
jgi:hypothetical protein